MKEGKVREYSLRNRLSELLMTEGYGVFVPLIDRGIDLIAHHEERGEFRLIQQKSRWTIARKYLGRNLWVAFPDIDGWYIAPHDTLVNRASADVLASKSWTDKGLYHRKALSVAMRADLREFRHEVPS